MHDGNREWNLVAVKRDWVPHWMYKVLCYFWLPWFGQLILYQPFRWFFHRKPTAQEKQAT